MVLAKARHHMPLHIEKCLLYKFFFTSTKILKQLSKKSPLSKEKLSELLSISRQGTITAPSSKISKVMDNISLNNCHLVDDSFNDKLPHSLMTFHLKLLI